MLYRINAQSGVYEEALTEAGVPFQVRGGEGFFARQEIRQSLVALQRAADGERGLPRWAGPARTAGLTPRRRRAPRPGAVGGVERACRAGRRGGRRPAGTGSAPLVAELRVRADARHPPTVQG